MDDAGAVLEVAVDVARNGAGLEAALPRVIHRSHRNHDAVAAALELARAARHRLPDQSALYDRAVSILEGCLKTGLFR